MERTPGGAGSPLFLLSLLLLTAAFPLLHTLSSPPGGPGVCAVTEEVEVLHNVTVYSPCIRRLEAPCAGVREPGRPTRMCTTYSQTTCTRVSSRIKLQNVTRYICCEGWHQDPRGYCTLDILPLPMSFEDITSYDTQPAVVESPTAPPTVYRKVTDETLTAAATETPSLPSTDPATSPRTHPTLIHNTTPIYQEPEMTIENITLPQGEPELIPHIPGEFNTDEPTSHVPTLAATSGTASTGISASTTTATSTLPTTTLKSTTTTTAATTTSTVAATPKIPSTTSQTTMIEPRSPWWLSSTTALVPIPVKTTLISTLAPSVIDKKTKVQHGYVTVMTIMNDAPVKNNSMLVHQSNLGMTLSPAVIVAVIIAIIVIVVTFIGCIYIFVFKDKPRAVSRDRDVRLNNIHHNDCNGSSQPSSSSHAERALPMPDKDNVNEFRSGAVPNGKPVCNGTPKAKKTEPPLTTSTPISRVSDKSGFGYNNPGFKVEGSDGSLSDVSVIGFPYNAPAAPIQNGNLLNTEDKEDDKNGGYMIPISKRDDQLESPQNMQPKAWTDAFDLKSDTNVPEAPVEEASTSVAELDADCVSENMENERRHEDLSSIHGGVYESIPADQTKEEDNSQNDLRHSSDTHTYEEIPGNIIKPETSKDSSSDIQVSHARMDSDPLGEIPGNVSEDLVTFMTNYLANTGSVVDLDVTYDQADMYTPATPGDVKIKALNTPYLAKNPEDQNKQESVTAAQYGTLQKMPKCEVVNEAPTKQDFARVSSFENIYDTVDPDAVMAQEEEEEELGEEAFVGGTPLLPPRRRILDSPVLPELVDTGEEYSVIDLSDEVPDDSVFLPDNSGLQSVQVEQSTLPVEEEEESVGQNINSDCSYVTLGPVEGSERSEDNAYNGERDESSEGTNSGRYLAGSSEDYGESDA